MGRLPLSAIAALVLLAASCTNGGEAADRRIAFAGETDAGGHHPNIFVMAPDRSGITQLTDTPYYDGEPAWSPDRSRIAFVSTRDGNPEIYVMNNTGANQMRLTETAATEGRPRWSPDGSLISFISDRDGTFDLFVMNADGTEQTSLTSDPAFDGAATWSPDGGMLAFASNRGGDGFDIYLLDRAVGIVTQLTEDPMDEAGPAWSPDGTRIAFFAGSFDSRQYGLYVMDADGANRVRLTDADGHVGFIPAWSPDGTSIAFEHQLAGGNHRLFRIDVATGSVDELINRPASWPAWSR